MANKYRTLILYCKLLVIIFPKLISNGVLVQSELMHRCFVVSFIFNPFNPKSDKNLISP